MESQYGFKAWKVVRTETREMNGGRMGQYERAISRKPSTIAQTNSGKLLGKQQQTQRESL